MKLSQMVIVAQAINRNREIFKNLPLTTVEELEAVVSDLQAVVNQLEELTARKAPLLSLKTIPDCELTLSEFVGTIHRPLKNDIEVKTFQLNLFPVYEVGEE